MQILDLAGGWSLEQKGRPGRFAATVPGCVHADLLAAGRIPDPYFRDNEERLQWIGEATWIYSRDFLADPQLLAHERVILECQGLDTFATIRLNGRTVARTDNMFRTYEFDVRPLLRGGKNRLEVRFDSPLPVMNKGQARRDLRGVGSVPWEPKGRGWVRKCQCNFGWDWGPVLVTCGIWRPLRLLAFDRARLRDVDIRQEHARGRVTLDVAMQAEVLGRSRCAAAVTVARGGRVVAESRAELARGRGQTRVRLDKPELWWPNGMGAQPLYEVTVDLLDGDGGLIDTATRRIGLRKLTLERKKDRWGESFHFAANGVPFFAKGANWIPADAIVTRLGAEDYAYLLQSAAAAHMNMLRVWGGGIYEEDRFYDLCDELGICVWQDFMFACSAYPTFDEDFMASVAAEAEDNIRRLRHHPCMALWCGNNELEMFVVHDERQGCMPWKEYRPLFDGLLPRLVKRLSPGIPYWPSSPHSPRGDRQDHANPRCGDAHLWKVWHGRQPFEWYRTCEHRFNSEFGFQSFPEPRTVDVYTEPSDRNVASRVMEHHQRSPIGNAVIMQYLLDWYRLPSRFDQTLWLTQILQGMAVKYAVEHWRRSMPRGMGTLYWQLNDCWPVASWSSIDSLGRWKALHYMARHFFQPLLVSGLENMAEGTVEIHVTSDLRESRRGRVGWAVTDLRGRLLADGGRSLAIPARKDALVQTLDLRRIVDGYDPLATLVWLDLESRGQPASRNLVLLARPKHLELEDPAVDAALRALPGGKLLATLTARRPALWTWLELDGMDAQYSDNFLHLRPGVPASIEIAPAEPLDVRRARSILRVSSLRDTYC